MGGFTGFELKILDAIQNLRNPSLDKIMVNATSLGNASIIWIIMMIIFLSTKEYRTLGKLMVVAFIGNVIIVNLGLKNIFGRTRPFDVANKTDLLIAKPKDGSFPSGHTSYAFTFLTLILFLSKSKAIKIMTSILSITIAISRLYLYVHFPSDVIAGAIVGILIATYTMKIYFSDEYIEVRKQLKLHRK